MEKAVHQVVRDHGLLPAGSRVLVAVSGGGDSVALLYLLSALAREESLTLCCAHLDHGIRPDGSSEAEFVAGICRELGVHLSKGRADAPARRQRDREGLEAAARVERREFLLKVAARQGCGRIALGHHRQDQVETVLFRLLRGTGKSGLASMSLQDGPWIRPLLPFSKKQLRGYLQHRGASWLEDPTNRDLLHDRNRIRHRLLPGLEEINPRYQEHIWQLSRQLDLEEGYWLEQVEQVLTAVLDRRGERLVLDRRALLKIHPALRVRVLRQALLMFLGGGYPLGRRHLEALERLLVEGPSQGEIHLPGVWAGRRYDRLWLAPEALPVPAPFEFSLKVPGRCRLPSGGEIEASLVTDPADDGTRSVAFDPSRLELPLIVRSFRPGDRFRPQGATGGKKLKDFFIDQRIDRETRAGLPLVFGPELLWVAGVSRCEGFRPVSGNAAVQLRLLDTSATSCL